MFTFAERIILAQGWRRRAIAFGCGACGALALAPVNIFPAMLIPMMAAVWLVDGSAEASKSGFSRWPAMSSLWQAASAGWWLGFGYFTAGLWWLGAAFLVEADKFAWALPLGVLGLPAILALFTALGFALARLLWAPGVARIFALATGLTLAEFLRGTLFTGFPWNLWGMSLGGNLVLGQAASLIGIYGLTALAILIFAAPATLADAQLNAPKARIWMNKPVLMSILLLIGLAAFGGARLAGAESGTVKGVKLRIMQPNLKQDAKFRPENKADILKHYLSLSDRSTSPQHTGISDATHLIWPESAFPFILARDPQALTQIGGLLPAGTVLLTGAARMESPDTNGGSARARYFNSIQAIASGGTILESADKVHLVPFGEYLPFEALLKRLGIQQFVHIPGGFDAGSKRKAMNVPGLPSVSPLICYEAIFPGEVTPTSLANAPAERPGLMLNVTNDGWFGNTSGPHQHLSQARLRSVEEGLPLVRAANTGISAVVDGYGRVIAQLPLGVEGVLDAPLPQRLSPTLFSQNPLTAPLAVWLAAFVLATGLRRFG